MPRPDVSEERRAQILDAALRVFARQGLYETRMDDIVAESGLSKGALYWYFKSKDAIITAILEQLFAGSMGGLGALAESTEPADACLAALAAGIAEDIAATAQLRPVLFEFYAIAGRDEGVRQFLKGYYDTFLAAIEATVRRGVAEGTFRPIDSAAAAAVIVAAFEGLLLLQIIDPAPGDLGPRFVAAAELLFAGMRV
ncbi:TetR/AcrR family transcriptional regulator [Oscillochloris sp. ZM17-4]|uniref:TetR/AcrR family transcriptional regulator n=1 Tax=Oscillochloris sp. ZM17-4 TaxID=2866714 RepID=UPI001C738661|nr:TetR/AcrR family transcriptional regulator [Oscillochloris sp. ZM17-4]MBX0329225.1 TetR/AcrR family transcriptional regulator [Oscillochloris sp. ZM17-4]